MEATPAASYCRLLFLLRSYLCIAGWPAVLHSILQPGRQNTLGVYWVPCGCTQRKQHEIYHRAHGAEMGYKKRCNPNDHYGTCTSDGKHRTGLASGDFMFSSSGAMGKMQWGNGEALCKTARKA